MDKHGHLKNNIFETRFVKTSYEVSGAVLDKHSVLRILLTFILKKWLESARMVYLDK
jgi:hypothetical protein